MNHRYIPLNNGFDLDTPQDDPEGRWSCSVDRETSDSDYFTLIEIHRSHTWDMKEDPADRKVVFRVSNFACGDLYLGSCVMLNKQQLQEVHDHLGRLLSEM